MDLPKIFNITCTVTNSRINDLFVGITQHTVTHNIVLSRILDMKKNIPLMSKIITIFQFYKLVEKTIFLHVGCLKHIYLCIYNKKTSSSSKFNRLKHNDLEFLLFQY